MIVYKSIIFLIILLLEMSIRINEKKRNISQDINKRNIVFEYTILYDLYKKEFIDYCEDILIKKENEFLTNFYKRM